MPPPVVLVHGFLAAPLLMTPLRRRMERRQRQLGIERTAIEDFGEILAVLDLVGHLVEQIGVLLKAGLELTVERAAGAIHLFV